MKWADCRLDLCIFEWTRQHIKRYIIGHGDLEKQAMLPLLQRLPLSRSRLAFYIMNMDEYQGERECANMDFST